MIKWKNSVAVVMSAALLFAVTGCQLGSDKPPRVPEYGTESDTSKDQKAQGTDAAPEALKETSSATDTEKVSDTDKEYVAPAEKNGDVYILFTSDVHCGIDQHFGYASVYQAREYLESQGYTVLLVDDGDSIQGEAIGTLSGGEAIIELMNDMRYDVAIPGNHEFDYGMDVFLDLTKKADFPYISCNFTKGDELVFEPYTIIEAEGMKIGFVGITTPKSLNSSTPKFFQNDKGEYIYGFCEDESGQKLYDAVQRAVDGARTDGADYVYIMGHIGLDKSCKPWTYDDVISHTNGIDVFLDGHSHDTEQLVAKNKDGVDVPRSAVGYKLNAFGYSHISKDKGIVETDIWTWPNDTPAPVLLGINNDMSGDVDAANEKLSEKLDEVVAHTDVDLYTNDPHEVDEKGDPVRIVRRAETNMGDLCADAIRSRSGADVAIINAGGVRVGIKKGDVTFRDIISVHPFGNSLCVLDVTGQQILDALEWGAKSCPTEFGGFLQVSGMSYEVDTSIKSPCKSDIRGMCSGIKGKRRVKNVKVGDEPIDPKKHYTLGGYNFTVKNNGDGHTAFNGSEILQDEVQLDNQCLIDYIVNDLGGKIGNDYSDPYGQGRITIR